MSNVISIPFDDIRDSETIDPIPDFMEDVTQFCQDHGVDTNTPEYRHKAAVIMTQLQVILRGL